jgi:thioredoxin-like negative regulator of GroEL
MESPPVRIGYLNVNDQIPSADRPDRPDRPDHRLTGPGGEQNAHDAYQQALALVQEGRPIEAAQIAAPLEQLDPIPEAFLEVLARAYFASAQLGRAERVLRRLIDQAPVNGWAHRALARTLERRSAGPEAVRYHRLADGFGVE